MHNVETKNKRNRCISPALIFVHHNSENPPRVQWYPDLCSNSWLKPPAIGDTSDIRQILQGTPTERTFCNSSQTKRGLYYSRYFYEVQTFLPHWRTKHSYWQHRPVILYVHFICMPPAFNTLSEETNIRPWSRTFLWRTFYEQLWKNKSMPTTDRGKNPEHKRGLISKADWR